MNPSDILFNAAANVAKGRKGLATSLDCDTPENLRMCLNYITDFIDDANLLIEGYPMHWPQELRCMVLTMASVLAESEGN